MEYIIFPDTSILWHEDKSNVVNPQFDEFWDNYSQTFNLELVIPEVVRGELLFQHYMSATKAMDKATEEIKKISGITEKNIHIKLRIVALNKLSQKGLINGLRQKEGESKKHQLK